MAPKDMVDRVTRWMEDTQQKCKTESMLELADATRDEMGVQIIQMRLCKQLNPPESCMPQMENNKSPTNTRCWYAYREKVKHPAPIGAEPIPDAPVDAEMEL